MFDLPHVIDIEAISQLDLIQRIVEKAFAQRPPSRGGVADVRKTGRISRALSCVAVPVENSDGDKFQMIRSCYICYD